MTHPTPLEERFWSHVEKTDGCWIWTAGRSTNNYGKVFVRGKGKLYAHRVSWELANGRSVPAGNYVMHSCDNPPCVNPSHLFAGTASDNVADMIAKGRNGYSSLVGEALASSKLTAAKVDEIRRLLLAGNSAPRVAKWFGVCATSVRNVRNGKTWKHVVTKSDTAETA